MSQKTDRRLAIVGELQRQFAADGIYIENYQFQDFQIIGNCSGIYKLKLTYGKNHRGYEKSVILKIPSEGFFYDHMKINHIYYNESYMYNVVLPEMYKFWNGAKFTPESYLLNSELEDLIIEDLVASGYRTANKLNQLDLEHTQKTLITLAKFHALSVKLHETSPQIVENLKCYYDLEPGSPLRAYTDTLYDRFLNTIEQFSFPKDVVIKLTNFKEQHLWREVNRTISLNDGFNVLAHSDVWTNNIMFSYDEDGTVEDAKLIDFQIVHRTSPAVDLILFFITSVKFEVFEQHRELLLKTYLDTLNEIMKDLNCAAFYDVKNLEIDLWKYRFMHVSVIATSSPVVLREEKNSASDDRKGVLPFSSPVYKDVAFKWIDYLIRRGIL